MYKVIKSFKDFKDNDYIYKANDIYPREGYKTNKKRIEELSTENNKRNTILIKLLGEQIQEEIQDDASREITEKNEDIKKEEAE